MVDLGFAYKKRSRAAGLLERDDIVEWRHKYLRKIRNFREDGRTIYFLDETWVNAGHTMTNVWQDSTIKSRRQAFVNGVTTGLKAPSGKGGRVIVVHCGNENGFVNGAGLVFRAKKSNGDYHQEMDGKRFENWFESLLPKLDSNSVIVLDNASYHTVRMENIPTLSWKKIDIQNWLQGKGIPFEESQIKTELLGLVHHVKHRYTKYRIDIMAENAGHTVLRLPPYHCELNPIEMVWSQVKGYVARNNRTFKLDDVEKLLSEGIQELTPEKWRNCVQHVITEEKNLWNLDFLVDDVQDRIVIQLNSENDSDSSDDGLSGIEEMEHD